MLFRSVGHAAEMGELLQASLHELEGVRQVRGRGLMQAVVFEEPVARAFQSRCLEEGVLVNAVDESTVRLVYAGGYRLSATRCNQLEPQCDHDCTCSPIDKHFVAQVNVPRTLRR